MVICRLRKVNKRRMAVAMKCLVVVLFIAIVATVCVLFVKNAGNTDPVPKAYVDLINGLDYPEGYTDYPYLNYSRFVFGYINDDDVPELLLGYGDAHADGVWVYSYDPQTDTIHEWGDFSSFGNLSYYERQGIVASQYGGMGFWYQVYEQAGLAGVEKVLAVEGSDASKENVMRYFWQSPCEMTSWETGREDFDFDKAEVSEEKQVEEYNAFLARLADEVDVAYRDMTPFSTKELYAAYREYMGNVSCD